MEVEGGHLDGPGDVSDVDRAELVDRIVLHAAGVALEHGRSLAQRPHDPVADGEVVLDQVDLAPGALRQCWEVHALGVGHLDRALAGGGVDLHVQERTGHDRALRRSCPDVARATSEPRRSRQHRRGSRSLSITESCAAPDLHRWGGSRSRAVPAVPDRCRTAPESASSPRFRLIPGCKAERSEPLARSGRTCPGRVRGRPVRTDGHDGSRHLA